MGGIGSGRSGGRPTVEDGLSLDIDTLRRQGLIRTGDGWGGTLTWSDAYTGCHRASIGYQGYMRTQDGGLRLSYTVTAQGTEHKAGCWIDLVTTPQPFGGKRGGSSVRKRQSASRSFICPLVPGRRRSPRSGSRLMVAFVLNRGIVGSWRRVP
jgi:hypothetical protein